MSNYSYVWDGIVTGDAVAAPYNASEWNKFLALPYLGGTDEALVVPGYLNSLNIKVMGEDSYSSVQIQNGAAYLKNFLYVTDEPITFTIAANATASYYRFDSVVLRIDYAARTIRMVLLTGIESSTYPPAAPTLIQTEEVIWEVELARIYVANTASNFVLTAGDVYDKRYFLESNKQKLPQQLLSNSEFLAFSGLNTVAVDSPECWDVSGSPSAITTATMLAPMKRGRACQITGGGISQKVLIRADSPVVSVKGLIYVVSGTATVTITGTRTNGLNSLQSFIRIIRDTAAVVEFQGTFEFDDVDIEYVTLTIASSGTDQFRLGQILLVNEYLTGSYREINETIPFRYPLTDTSWDGDAKSDGTTTVNLSVSFGGYVLVGTKAVIIQARANDSASAAAATCTLYFSHPLFATMIYGGVQIAKVQNGYHRRRQVIVPVDFDSHTTTNLPRFNIVVDATGAATMGASVEIVGIIT